MLSASPDQLEHSWEFAAKAASVQEEIDLLLEVIHTVNVADRFLRRKATIGDLRAAVKAAKNGDEERKTCGCIIRRTELMQEVILHHCETHRDKGGGPTSLLQRQADADFAKHRRCHISCPVE